MKEEKMFEEEQHKNKENRNSLSNIILKCYYLVDPLSKGPFLFIILSILIDGLLFHSYFNSNDIILIVDKVSMNLFQSIVIFVCLCVIQILYNYYQKRDIYLIDFTTFKGKPNLQVSRDTFSSMTRNCKAFSEDLISFQLRVLEKNGFGEQTCFPPVIFQYDKVAENISTPQKILNMENARLETETVVYECIEELFQKNQISSSDIDILIVNCSLFNPTPSISAMIVNKFKMRNDIITYNLSGMGCSAGLIAISLAKDLLSVHKNSNCIVVSTENISQNWYFGKRKSMLLTNTLFRMGGAAVFLSNKLSNRYRAHYKLLHVVRTHYGSNDDAYCSVFQKEDEDGIRGVELSRSIMSVSSEAIRQNICTLGPLILPISEKLKFLCNVVQRKLLQKKIPSYIPDFKKTIQHFCIHTGGKSIIDTIETVLNLSRYDCEPSRFSLYRFGNTSSASIWYELEFIEKSNRVKRGDRIWQLAFGSGFKCNSGIWKAMKTIEGSHTNY